MFVLSLTFWLRIGKEIYMPNPIDLIAHHKDRCGEAAKVVKKDKNSVESFSLGLNKLVSFVQK